MTDSVHPDRPSDSVDSAAVRRHPFIEFPLWGLEVALTEHKAQCAACSGDLAADCARVRYSDMLRDKIERLTRVR